MGNQKWITGDGECTFERAEQAIWLSKNLSMTEKAFYQGLKSFLNRKSKQCFPSIRTVCDRVGISKDAAYPARQKLKDMGIIEFSSERGRNKSCSYRFILENGNTEEISIALSNLSENKIGGNKDSENRRNKGQSLVGNKDSKIGGNKDRNQKKDNQKKITHTEPDEKNVCVSSSEIEKAKPNTIDIPQEILDSMERDVERCRNNGGFKTSEGAYRAGLIRKWKNGEYICSGDEDLSEFIMYEDLSKPIPKYIELHSGECKTSGQVYRIWNEVTFDNITDKPFGEWWPEFYKEVLDA